MLLIGWQYFFGIPQMEKQKQAAELARQQQQAQRNQTQTQTQATSPGASQQATTPAHATDAAQADSQVPSAPGSVPHGAGRCLA